MVAFSSGTVPIVSSRLLVRDKEKLIGAPGVMVPSTTSKLVWSPGDGGMNVRMHDVNARSIKAEITRNIFIPTHNLIQFDYCFPKLGRLAFRDYISL
jgi:hypothetical protein